MHKNATWSLARQLFLSNCFLLLLATSLPAADTLSPTASRLQERVRYLASEELEGRKPGTTGGQKAAVYIEEQFKAIGLQPLGASYKQQFPVQTAVQLGKENTASIGILVVPEGLKKEQGRLQQIPWKGGREYTPLAFSEEKTVSGALVFAGYGITAKEAQYDDYEGVNVEGKVVIVLRGTPDYADMRTKFSEKKQANPHNKFANFASLRYKALNARQHGAVGIMFVSPQGDSADILLPLTMERGGAHSGIVAIQAKRSILNRIFTKTKSFFKAEEQIIATKKPASFELEDISMTINVDLDPITQQTENVIGMIPGSDGTLAKEYIVVGAHFDHLGWGGEGSLHSSATPAIHYGADDNASGVAAIIELATKLKANPLPRSVVFIAFSGEEMGLLGSAFYAKNPSVPMEQTAFMMNLDMVGRMKNKKLNIHGTGTAEGFEELVKAKAQPFGLTISTSADGFGPSDHTSFYTQDVPVLFLFTGLHEDYHRPTDTWEKLNYAGIATVVDYAETLVRSIGSETQKPKFIKVQSSAGDKRSMAFSVYVGTIPDYSDHPKGLRITGVREGGPAEKAGMKDGDVIIKFGDIDVKNVYDYTHALSTVKPGDTIKVVVLRGSQEDQKVTLDLTLEARQ